tara:strand:- start:511 stop:990 length:480 start_codon:yes stop_codon:yes gene_type:complete
MNAINTKQTEQVLESLYQQWGQSALYLQIASLETKRVIDDPIESKVVSYTISSLNRSKFIAYIQRATFENQWLSIQDLVQLIDCERGTLETMIKDVEGYGILDIKRDEKNKRYIKASKKLMGYYQNYTKWLFKFMTENGGAKSSREIATAILQIEKAVQ